jgi:hypothetical protein
MKYQRLFKTLTDAIIMERGTDLEMKYHVALMGITGATGKTVATMDRLYHGTIGDVVVQPPRQPQFSHLKQYLMLIGAKPQNSQQLKDKLNKALFTPKSLRRLVVMDVSISESGTDLTQIYRVGMTEGHGVTVLTVTAKGMS